MFSRSSAKNSILYVVRIWNQRHTKANNNLFLVKASQCDFKVIDLKIDIIRDMDMESTPYQSKKQSILSRSRQCGFKVID